MADSDNPCPKCGGKQEQPGREGICYACHLEGLVPPGYSRKEDYAFDRTWGHVNATRKPPTGIGLLDQPHGETIQVMLLKCRSRPRLS